MVAMEGQVADMGVPIAEGGYADIQGCLDWCNYSTRCNSMNVCEGGPGPYCYLFNKTLSGYEPVTTGHCTTYRKIVPGNFSIYWKIIKIDALKITISIIREYFLMN